MASNRKIKQRQKKMADWQTQWDKKFAKWKQDMRLHWNKRPTDKKIEDNT